MNKLQMAQEYALKMLENLNPMQIDKPTRDGIAYECFELAEAMLAENDKRVVKLPDVFFDADKNEEWQPDWSQAPDDKITHWTMEKDKRYSWWIGEPKKDSQNHSESIENANCSFYGDAPSFNYAGNWQDSLRKRP